MSDEPIDGGDGGDIQIIVPTDEQWVQAAYLQLKPYDTSRAMQLDAGPKPIRIPLLGTIRHYAVELVLKDETWTFLYFGTDLVAAKQMIQSLSARHDVPIQRLAPEHSDVENY